MLDVELWASNFYPLFCEMKSYFEKMKYKQKQKARNHRNDNKNETQEKTKSFAQIWKQ